jgi:DNA-binding response OmpR family regulator
MDKNGWIRMDKKPKILVIDDEPDFSNTLKIRLESNGYEVVVAGDGISGLGLARSLLPDLIILDLMLPKMDGFRVARFLKFDDRHKKVPIIVLSARSQASDIKMGMEVGADLYITKPFKSEELLGVVSKLLGV